MGDAYIFIVVEVLAHAIKLYRTIQSRKAGGGGALLIMVIVSPEYVIFAFRRIFTFTCRHVV